MNRMYRLYGKRILDILLSSLGIIILSPVMVLIAIFIKLEDGGKVMFKQTRMGLHKKPFIIYKFRTMIENAYEIGGIASSESDLRITKAGRFLRKTSLDELPQLFNILNGTMSIIGPRPILSEEFETYADKKGYEKRFSVLPGMFCTVDMEQRATASRDEQFQMDVAYIQNMSLMLDIHVFLMTFVNVLRQKNVYRKK